MKQRTQYLISLIILSSFFSSCICKEPAFFYDYSLNNSNASLYILNHSDCELCVQLNKDDGTFDEKIIKPVKNEKIDSKSLHNRKKDTYIFISYNRIKETDSDYDNAGFPYSLDDCALICSNFENTEINMLTIKNDDEVLYSSKVAVPDKDPVLTFVHYTPVGYAFKNIDKNFNNGDFLFQNRIGDYLFVDFDEIDFSDKTNLSLQKPRYIIVIGEIITDYD